MSQYAGLVKDLRETAKHLDGISRFPYDDDPAKRIYSKKMADAAAAIEALQAELEKKRTAECWGCKCEKVEPKRGEWIGVNPMVDSVQCSICGGQLFSAELETPYCPYCGAKMEVQE